MLAGVEVGTIDAPEALKPIDGIEGLGRLGSEPAAPAFAFFTFSLLSASESPAIDFDVSRESPSRRLVDALNVENADGFFAGSETDRGDPLPFGMDESCLEVLSEPSCCG